MPAVLLFVGACGRTFREAQANVSLLLAFAAFVPFLPMFLQKKDPPWLIWVPVSGQYSLLSRALRGEALPWTDLLQSYVVPALLTVVALTAVGRLFSRESLLVGR